MLFHQQVAHVSTALSHPARVQIVLHLAAHGETRFDDLLQRLPLQQPTVSQHLRILMEHNLLFVREEIPHTLYRLNPVEGRKAMLVLTGFLDALSDGNVTLVSRVAQRIYPEDFDW